MAHTSALCRPPRHPPDHITTNSGIPVPLTTEQPVSITRACASHSGNAYTTSMLDIHRVVTASGLPNSRAVRIHLPSNFIFKEWEAITHSQADREVIQYLRYGCPTGFEGPIHTPSFSNHASAINHPRYVKAYVTTELAE